MKSLAIASQKGGVGKTTVALNLSFAFATRRRRTLLVDCDSQGAIGLSLAQDNRKPGLASIVMRGDDLAAALVQTNNPFLAILPTGAMRAVEAPELAAKLLSGEFIARLNDALREHYDLVIYDTPSGFTGATIGALRSCDFVLSPLQAEPIAARSLSQLLSIIGELRAEGSKVTLAGVVLSMLQLRDESSFSVAQEVWDRLPSDLVFDAHIPRDAMFLAASKAGVPVGLLSRTPPPVASVFDQLALELEGVLKLSPDGDDDGPIALIG